MHIGALEKKRVTRRDKHKAARSDHLRLLLPDETATSCVQETSRRLAVEAVKTGKRLDLENPSPGPGRVRLRGRGESMIDDHLCDGDYFVLERRENAER